MKKFFFPFTMLIAWPVFAQLPEYLVTGEAPSPLEKKAEEELCYFYKAIYHKPIKKTTASLVGGKPAIYLGRTAYAKFQNIDAEKFEQEEWLLKTCGKNIIIIGGRPVGTLYGVYRMLELMGTAFLAPDETVLPAASATVPHFNERRKPAFAGRAIYDGIGFIMEKQKASPEAVEAYRLWVLRTRINGSTVKRIPPYYKGQIYNLCHWPEWHTLSLYVNPDLFETHPEYFAMDRQGKRNKPRSFMKHGDICMSNPGVRKVALESLRKMIRKNRSEKPQDEWSVVYDVTRLDDTPEYCQCPACRKISEYDGSDTGLLVDFSNYIAREIRKEYPDIIIRIQGHEGKGRKLPNKIIPEKNILFRLCDTFNQRDPFRPIEKVAAPQALAYFKNWTKFGTSHVKMLWDYWNLGNIYFNPPRVETVFDALQPDFRYFLRYGINALFIEVWLDQSSPQNFMMLNFFTATRLMVDPDENPEELADFFIRNYYGAQAAPVMRKYFDLIREGVRNDPQKPSSLTVGTWKFATPDFLLNLYRDFGEVAANEKESRYADRIRYELITPIWSILSRWQNCEQTFLKAGISREKLMAECRAYAKKHIRRFPSANPKYGDNAFREKFSMVEHLPVIPNRFKNIPSHDIRIAVYNNFYIPKSLYVSVVDDPESIQGKAVKSAHPDPRYHGVNKVMPGPYKFRTTGFYVSSNKKEVGTVLKKVYQDEKYHWYHIPGPIVLDTKSNFWGQGWAINARTNHWYMLTYGDVADNTWDHAWFSAKFTGPAYVKDSKKGNAVWVDAVILTREPGKKK